MDLVLYNNKDGKSLMTVIYNGRECWVAGHVAELSGIQNPTATINNFLKDSDLDKSIDYEILRGESLSYFKSIVDSVGCQPTSQSYVGSNASHITIFYESGLWAFLSSLRTEDGKALRKWINREILPSIRKTGSYAVAPEVSTNTDTIRLMEAYDKFMARVDHIARMSGKNYEINAQRAHNVASKLLGLDMHWAIELPAKYMNATQIAQELGVYTLTDKANPAYGFIGKICADLDLTPDEVIRCEDKSPTGKTITVTNYFPSVMDKVKAWLQDNEPSEVTYNGKQGFAYKFKNNNNASYVEFRK